MKSLARALRRQVVVEPYIVDFVCLEAKLIVEADGGQHMEEMEYDTKRTDILQSMEYEVMRFWNHEILGTSMLYLNRYSLACLKPPHPNPLPEGEGVNPQIPLTRPLFRGIRRGICVQRIIDIAIFEFVPDQ